MKEHNYILFEDYLAKNLTEEAQLAFEDRLQHEPDFQQDFKTYKELSNYLENTIGNENKSNEFQNNLKNISNTYFKKHIEPKKTNRFKPWKIAIAACFALFFGVLTFNILSTPTYSDFASYNNISLTVRGTQDELLDKAEEAFNAKKFNEATTYFSQLLEKDTTNLELQLYNAISQIEINKYNEADTILTKVSQGNSAYKNKALWYLALSKLKQKEYSLCVEILKTIPEDADDFKTAQKLLNKL